MLSYQKLYGRQSISGRNGAVARERTKSVDGQQDVVQQRCLSSSGSEPPAGKISNLASEKHAIAEKHRRERINRHLNTLRDLFPQLTKTDKATVLTETVRQVRELKKKMGDHADLRKGGGESKTLFLPDECDEATVCVCGGDRRTVKATVCCEDRPELSRELTEAVRLVNGTVVKANIVSIGGRTKAAVVVQWRRGGGEEDDVGSLRRALKAVVENRALSYSRLLINGLNANQWAASGQNLPSVKRPRLFSSINNDVTHGPPPALGALLNDDGF